MKVQRPGIRDDARADIALMYSMTWILDWTHVFGATRSREVIDEFARWTADELDYLVEARQAVLLYQNAQGDKVERIARVHRDYTTSRVLTTELIVGIPLIDIMIAKREGNSAYLEALAARGHDLDRIVRNLDWNMLNQVYVFGYFHADLHPANLFVLPGDAIGYVDFGIVGQLPDRVRDSLTRYSWLLFRGEVESAVLELMRWLAPGPATDIATTRWQLIRVHQAFLYDTVADRLRMTAEAPGPARARGEPVFEAGGRHPRHDPRPAADDVGQHRRLPQDAGHARHASSFARRRLRPQENVRRFVRRLARQQGLALLDPRRTFDRLYAGTGRIQRALEFLEFIEAQEPVIIEVTNLLFGYRNRIRRIKSRLIGLGTAVLVVGGLLYLVLVYPDDTRRILPKEMDYTWCPARHPGGAPGPHRRQPHPRAWREDDSVPSRMLRVTDMDTAAGEGLRRRRGGGREGHARNAAARSSRRGPSRACATARPRSSRPTSSSRSTSARCASCPRSGWTSSTPTRARSCARPGATVEPGLAARPVRPRDGHRADPDGAVARSRSTPGTPRTTSSSAATGSPSGPSAARPTSPTSTAAGGSATGPTTRTCCGSPSRSTPSTSCRATRSSRSTSTTASATCTRRYDALTLMDKPIHAYSLGRQRNIDALEMVRIARGVDDATLDREPSIFTVVNSSSPLRLDAPMLQGIMEFAARNQVVVHHAVHAGRGDGAGDPRRRAGRAERRGAGRDGPDPGRPARARRSSTAGSPRTSTCSRARRRSGRRSTCGPR